ncbi:MAG: 3-hydroxybutyryl-CoA dehydrogenase [Acidobacteria bacterium]|nr:3-hydroxybutyryl-CoA dehydrogenase [Acidobacteriota bacterium]
MSVNTVGVLGCGLMGSGIAQVSASAGFKTYVLEVNDSALQKGMGRIEKFLADGVAKGKLSAQGRDTTIGHLVGTTRYADLEACELIIEAIIENVEEKKKAYAQVEAVVGADCLIATNTSSLSVTELAAGTKRPSQFGGLHFFNPVPLMKLVEVVKALTTSAQTHEALVDYARAIGKEPIAAPDRGGFIVNRLLVPYLLDAIRCLDEGLGTVEDIDKGMKLGCGYPMGPFTLLDFVGLDTTYFIANILFDEFRETRFAPPPLLKRMVLAGHLGKKSGKGFYEYSR